MSIVHTSKINIPSNAAIIRARVSHHPGEVFAGIERMQVSTAGTLSAVGALAGTIAIALTGSATAS